MVAHLTFDEGQLGEAKALLLLNGVRVGQPLALTER
jgi:hypothetical protein